MAVTVTPRLTLSANGASALVDTAGRGFRVYEVPDGRMRWDLGDGEDLSLATLSASGNALAWVGEAGDLTVLSGAGRVAGRLPASRDRVRAVAPSDDGDLVACLIAGGVEDDGDVGESRLVIAPSANGGAVAAVGLPVYETGFVLANDDCSLILAGSSEHLGERRVVRAFVRDDDELRPLWTEREAPTAYGALVLYGEWIFAATAEKIAGWRRSGERVALPGSMRERMIFSRDGRHLLVYRVEEVIEVTSARILFRLIDLASLDEGRRTSHVVADRQGAQFALDADLDLVEVRVTRVGELKVETLDWYGSD